jgi:hypothetical protein
MAIDLDKWRTRQINAAISRGVNPIDATKAVAEFLAALPVGADPDTYVRPAWQLDENIMRREYRDDANAAFYGDVEPRFARILDAGESA